MKWSPVYHVSSIFRNHMTADVLWVKVTLLSAYLQTKWRLKRTCFDGEIEYQTRVPPLLSPTCDLSSVLRVNCYWLVAICDIVHDVEAIRGNSIWESFLK